MTKNRRAHLPTEYNQGQSFESSKKNRRILLTEAFPAAVALIAAACRGPAPNTITTGSSDKNGRVGPGNIQPDLVATPEPLVQTDELGRAVIAKSKETDTPDRFESKIYGDTLSAMLVLRIKNIRLGDQIVIGFPVQQNVQIISQRAVQSNDLENPIVIDNINLFQQQQLDVYIYSADCARRHGTIKTSEDELRLARSFNNKPVVDARTIAMPVNSPVYEGPHTNFFALMPMLEWSDPTEFIPFHGQRDLDGMVNRPFKVAKVNAMWKVPPDLLNPNFTILICNAMGEEITGAKQESSNFLAHHSMFIVYILDPLSSDHYHRYFYFVG